MFTNRTFTRVALTSASVLCLSVFIGCGSMPRPMDLNVYDNMTRDKQMVDRMETIAGEDLAQARDYYQKAEEACEANQEEPCKHYAALSRIKMETVAEKVKADYARKRELSATQEFAQYSAEESDYSKRVARMKRIIELKEELASARSSSEQKMAQMNLTIEEQKLADQKQQKKYAEQHEKLTILLNRNALFEQALDIVGKNNVRQTYAGIVLSVRGLFAPGKSEVKPEKEQLIQQLAQLANQYQQYPVVIEGHTDSRGGKTSNLAISQGRAQTVMNDLIEKQVNMNRVKAVGFGETRPITDNSTKDGREANRRIDVKFLFTNEVPTPVTSDPATKAAQK